VRQLVPRAAWLVVVAILLSIAVAAGVFAIGSWTLEDMHVYLDAAHRLRDGETLYSTTNPLAAYQYAPWWAAAWVPLTFLPEPVVSVAWSAVLIVASFVSVRPLLRHPGRAAQTLMLLMLPILLFSSARSGNVQPLLIAGLVTGLERRWGPAAIAAAASLKAFPLALALVYLGRGEWLRFTLTLLISVALVGPMLLFDLSQYTVDGPRAGTLYDISPVLWAAPVAGLVVVTILLARRRSVHAWLAAAATVVAGMPRMLSYDITFLLAGTTESPADLADDEGTAVRAGSD
jgi:glycosyl transferase family 87